RRGRVLRPHLGDPDGGQHRDRGHLPGARGPAARAAPAARVARGAGGGSRELARPVRLEGRTVVVGLTGGIACYKACEVVRLLVGAGARAPAMNGHTWRHAAVQAHLARLLGRGARIVGPASGALACGYEGTGRLAEPADIVEEVCCALTVQDLRGERVLVSAGPTREPIDPVRYLSNHSSGKMGYAVA